MHPNVHSIIHQLPATTDDLIFGYLSLANLVAYSRTCRDIHEAVASFYRRAFRIENTLRKYFSPDEVVRFRELQVITGMIISGSTALGFFDRTEYDNSNLDLYVDHRFRRPIAVWLQRIGYKFLPRPALGPETLEIALEHTPETIHDESYLRGTFVLDFIMSKRHSRVQLITTSASPLEMVLRFHSTCIMNLVTHDKAYSIFPQATFEDRRSLIFVKDGDSALKARAKYEERGWAFVEGYEVQTRDPLSPFGKGNRRLGDSKCWSISLHPEQYRTTSHCHWESNSWKLVYANNRTPGNIWALLDNPRVFHFTYLINQRLAFRLRNEAMTIGYNEETGEWTDFYTAMMTRMSRFS